LKACLAGVNLRPTFLRYIRLFLIWVIALVALSVLANYFYSQYQQNHVEKKDLPILNSEMVQSAQSIEYSDNRDGILRFRIVASQLVETRQGKNFLQGIKAFDLNEDGSIRNEIQSQNALFDRENRTVDFIDDVRLFLGRGVELHTDSLHYDLNSNIGATEDLVRFYSESVTGEALGLHYNLNTRLLELVSSVDLLIALQEPSSPGAVPAEEFHAVSDRALTYDNLNRIELLGSARLDSDTLQLTGDAIRAVMDATANEMESLVASGNVQYSSKALVDSRMMSGDLIVFKFHSENRSPESIFVSGHASLDFASATETKRLKASEIDLHLNSEHRVPSRVDGRGNIDLEIQRGVHQILISGESFGAVFFPGTQRLKQIEVRQKASIFTTGNAGSKSNEIGAEYINMTFGQNPMQSVLEELRAENAASWTFSSASIGGARASVSSGKLTASSIEMHYSSEDGTLDSVKAFNDVVMTELSSGKNGNSSKSTIFADNANFRFYSGENIPREMYAEGNVQIVQQDDPNSGQDLGGLHTWSDRLQASFARFTEGIVLASASQWGNFRYEGGFGSANSGRCEFDAQEEKIILSEEPEISLDMGSATGDVIELDRKSSVLWVRGKVRSVLSGGNKSGLFRNFSENPGSIILADTMEYQMDSKNIRYSTNVYLLSEDQQLQADTLEISRDGEHVIAKGGVRHRISGKRVSDPGTGSAGQSRASISKENRNSEDKSINIQSAILEYAKAASTIIYSGGISLRTSDLILKSEMLEAVMADAGNAIERATATKDVVVFKETWECKGKVAYYFSDPEKFVVTGSPLELFDPAGVRSFPHRLTYNVADDRIQLERENN